MPPQPKKQAPGYYLRFRGQTTGPYSLQQVRDAIAQGSVSRLHDVSRDQVKWFPIHTHPAILDNPVAAIAGPAAPAGGAAAQGAPQGPGSGAAPTSGTVALDHTPKADHASDPHSVSADPDTADLIDSILREPRK